MAQKNRGYPTDQRRVDFKPLILSPQFITFFKRGPVDPSQQCKATSNSIQDPPPRWILTIFKLKFGGGNLFSPTMTSTIEGNNSVGSLLKPLLKEGDPVVGSRMLCCRADWKMQQRNILKKLNF
jgi:hypothetical protein